MVGTGQFLIAEILAGLAAIWPLDDNIAKVLILGHAKFRLCKLVLKLTVFKTLEKPVEML